MAAAGPGVLHGRGVFAANLSLPFMLFFFFFFLQGPSDNHWSYEDLGQWAKHSPACAGNMQSPININTETTIFSPQLRPIQLSGYSLPASQMLTLENNGHTVVLILPESLAIAGGYAQQYRAKQLHLHWGSPSKPGSEHTVDHRRFAGELHVVHYNTKYKNFTAALTKPDGLAVLGVFLEVGPRENPYYQQILEHLHSIQGKGDKVFVPGFNIAGLLPDNLHFYFRYNGSLTTPPCHESVKWTIFNQTVMLSKEQMSILVSSLQSDDNHILMNNFRPDQSLHRRWVLASFEPSSSWERQMPVGGGTSATAGHTSSFHAGDVLAVLFGVLFAITMLAFLLYVYKNRSQNARLDSPTKSKVIYTAATAENTA
ncbi:carbonic anhydrase 9-like isoform X2 [Meleagris gallopavo]|uniref:carbonic anhydrase 9-like isoform X2 n=1 Tax=Meleagris gallopavo TaxID=9103 RepID=UPI00093DF655|nr:carbonic anhydrase 9-like isoform X2 [Meleagris gallopavo]